MKPQNPSFPLMLLAGVFASACGGSTEINYVEATGGSSGNAGSGGSGAGGSSCGEDCGVGGSGGTNSGGMGGTSGSSSVDSGGMGGTSGGSSVSSGGVGGSTAGNGGSGGDQGCLATGCPAGDYCDGDTRECHPLKTAGEACDLSQQCEDLLDCVDGVCCTERECPACQNCGGDGACSITVQDTEDLTGDECMDSLSCDPEGVCRQVLGQSCYSDEECVSGTCLDGVCCGETDCPECWNCGDDGSCSLPVQDADDFTSECSGISTCNYDSECTTRWAWVTAIDVSEVYVRNYSTAVGSTLYFANAQGYHKGYDTFTGYTVDAPLNDDYCWCGATGVAVSDGSSMFYFGNDGRTWMPGYDTWIDVAGYSDTEVKDGEGAFAVTDGRVYRLSGRTHEDRLSYYDIYYQVFVTEGLAEHPIGGVTANACGGAVNGKVYVFGWGERGTSEYDPVTNTWTVIESDPNAPYNCYWQNAPALGSYLLYAEGEVIKALDTTRLQWEEGGIPLPDTENLTEHMAMVVGDQLYAVGYESSEKQIHIYQFTESGSSEGGGGL